CLFVVKISFVEDNNGRDAISFSRDQESIYKSQGSFRIKKGSYEHSLVYIGCDNMAIAWLLGGPPNNIIFTVVDRGNDPCVFTVLLYFKCYLVAHCNRVGNFRLHELKLPPHAAWEDLPFDVLHHVPRARRFYYSTFFHYLFN